MYLRRQFLLGLALCLGDSLVHGQGSGGSPRVVIVSSDTAPAYAQTAQVMVEKLRNQGIAVTDIQLLLAAELALQPGSLQTPRPQVFVALGSGAMRLLLARGTTTPILSALIPQRSFEQIVRASGRKVSGQLSAIYFDQPLQRQLALLQLALPQVRQIGVLTGPDSSDKLTELGALAQARGWVLRHAQVTGDEALYPALREVLDGSDVLLALADPLVFNSISIRNILMSSFRARVPMLAFSPAYERAGAVMSLYTTPSQVGAQAAREVQALLRTGHLADHALAPDDFEVAVNQNVARSLGLALDGAALRQALRRMEGKS